MGPGAVAPLAFVATLCVFLCLFLLWQARRVRASEALRRRLGVRRVEQDTLVKGEASGFGLAQVVLVGVLMNGEQGGPSTGGSRTVRDE